MTVLKIPPGRLPQGLVVPRASSPATDPDAALWKAAVVAAGGTVSNARLALVSQLNTSLKAIATPAGNAFLTYDRLWFFAGENIQSDTIDMKSLQAVTQVGAITTVIDRGMSGNGATYINTNYNPVANGVRYTQDAAHISFYMNVYDGVNIGKGGAFNPDVAPRLDSWVIGPTTTPAGGMEALINVSGDPPVYGSGLTTGPYLGDRINSTTVLSEHNGALLGTNTPAASFAPANLQFFVCAVNDDATPVAFDTSRYAMFSCGGSFGSAAAGASVAAAITTYLTAIGAN